jgi:osmoprotectant transport system permease protein
MRYVSVIIALLLLLAAGTRAATPPFRVGSKAFTEGIILGELVAQTTSRGRATSDHRLGLGGTRIVWNALKRGEIDAYVEYTGTIAQEIFAGRIRPDLLSIDEALRREGVRMTAPLGFNNTYALGMREARARELGIATISDLRSHPELRLGLSNEFIDRNDGWAGLRTRYALGALRPRGMDHDLAYRGLADGQIDVVDLYSTDAEIAYYGLRVLQDDRKFFPPYEAVVLYRAELDTTYPRLRSELDRLVGTITETEMAQMNAAVKLGGASEASVARRFASNGFAWRSDTTARSEAMAPAPRRDRAAVAGEILTRTLEHITLVAVSLLFAILAGIPLGILASRVAWLGPLVLSGTSIIYTIPSLALLVMMIPLFGIGATPVFVALFLYSLLPIVRNTFTGLRDIAPPLIESAIALGLPSRARLRRVELPLAMPTIIAGVKTAAVMNVATATIGALVGAGGYGQPILTGIRLDDMGLILEGAVPAAVMALAIQGLFSVRLRRSGDRRRRAAAPVSN